TIEGGEATGDEDWLWSVTGPFGLRLCRGCGSVLVVVLWLVGSRRRARFVYWSADFGFGFVTFALLLFWALLAFRGSGVGWVSASQWNDLLFFSCEEVTSFLSVGGLNWVDECPRCGLAVVVLISLVSMKLAFLPVGVAVGDFGRISLPVSMMLSDVYSFYRKAWWVSLWNRGSSV
ncbi:hypothetical protein ISN44_As09g006830, partial [Arabidopsis suecica]